MKTVLSENQIKRKRYRVASFELPADLETPVSAYLKLRRIGASFLLESSASSGRLGRYSFIGFDSGRFLASMNGKTAYTDDGNIYKSQGDPLETVRKILAITSIESDGVDLPPLLGAALGYVSYDYVRHIEEIDGNLSETPECQFGFVESLVAFDHLRHKLMAYSLFPAKADSTELESEIRLALENQLSHEQSERAYADMDFTFNSDRREYEAIVDAAKRHIFEGDCFQVVLSRRLSTQCNDDCFGIYRRLRMTNPSPYMFYLDFGERKVIGASPEVLVKLTGRRALISPIAGTRPRGADAKCDAAYEAELLADEKERAEHVMLVDLARNDLARVCRYGTISVEGYMRIERYSHVMHIVSDVYGELSDDVDQFDLFRASFPAGTVTGAPKVRAMEIISEQERLPRGLYGGAVGYFSPFGDMDTCIAIRTILVENGVAYIQAGAGIVADSISSCEFTETGNKMAVLKEAVSNTGGG
ncbi:MAG: anthranilate synthase component I [Planctomycetota bacterium]